jgi:hypothetical protein
MIRSTFTETRIVNILKVAESGMHLDEPGWKCG